MKRKAYPSGLTDAQWNLLKGLLPPTKPGGQPRSVDLHEVINGILSVVRGGCSGLIWCPGTKEGKSENLEHPSDHLILIFGGVVGKRQ